MAVTKTQLAAVRDTANSGSLAVTLSRAITANKPCLAFYFGHSTAPTDTATASGGGVTWTKRATAQRGNIRVTVFSADGVASPSGTTVTFTNVGATSPTANDAFVYEIDGSDGTPSGWRYIANEAAASATLVLTLGSAPAAGDYGLAAVAYLATGGISWNAGVEDSDSTHASPSCNSAVNSISSSPPTALTTTGTAANVVGGYVGIVGGVTTQTVSPAALGGATIPAPSIAQQVAGPAALGGATIPAPNIQSSVPVAALGGATLPQPTIAQQVVMAALGGASIPAPTIAAGGATQTVTPGILGGATIPQPAIAQSVAVAVLGGATIPAPAIQQTVAIAVLGGASIPAPAITQKAILAALGGASLPQPSIAQNVVIAVLGGASLPAPTVVGAQLVSMGALGGALLLEPIIALGGGTVSLSDVAAYVAAVLDVDVASVTVIDLPYYGVSLSDS